MELEDEVDNISTLAEFHTCTYDHSSYCLMDFRRIRYYPYTTGSMEYTSKQNKTNNNHTTHAVCNLYLAAHTLKLLLGLDLPVNLHTCVS